MGQRLTKGKKNKAFKTQHEDQVLKQTKLQILRGYGPYMIKAFDQEAEYLDTIPPLPLTSSMTFGKLIHLSVP